LLQEKPIGKSMQLNSRGSRKNAAGKTAKKKKRQLFPLEPSFSF